MDIDETKQAAFPTKLSDSSRSACHANDNVNSVTESAAAYRVCSLCPSRFLQAAPAVF